MPASDMPASDPIEQQIHEQLQRLRDGHRDALDTLLPLLSEDLRRLARAQRWRNGGGETMRTTALIHEAYLKLRKSRVGGSGDRQHFLHTAALAMRHILIDHARSKLAARQREQRIVADTGTSPADLYRQAQRVIDIDAALAELETRQPRWAQVVNCRYFAGYSERETSALLGISERTVRRDWFQAKAWLALTLDTDDGYPRTE